MRLQTSKFLFWEWCICGAVLVYKWQYLPDTNYLSAIAKILAYYGFDIQQDFDVLVVCLIYGICRRREPAIVERLINLSYLQLITTNYRQATGFGFHWAWYCLISSPLPLASQPSEPLSSGSISQGSAHSG